MALLYGNENFPQPAVEELRRRGHDVLTVLETGKSDQAWPDEAVLTFATEQKRALLTLNRKHFIQLHKTLSNHAGIIVCTFDRNFADLASRIHAAISTETALDGKLIRINRPNLG